MSALVSLLAWMALASFMPETTANWDQATGHARDYRPTDEWLAANKALVITKEIQVAECATNTRLHFPAVQLFAYHKVNHSQDNYHGCTYGDCYAYDVFPQLKDLTPDFTNYNSFFWHGAGGLNKGTGTNNIVNPQTGAFGYEDSISGHYHDGKPDYTKEQVGHDSHYATFLAEKDKLPIWSQEDRDRDRRLGRKKQPLHPKCGRPCEPNQDPGQTEKAHSYKAYTPAKAEDYSPPPLWKPTEKDTCYRGWHGKDTPAPINPPEKGDPTKPSPSKPSKSAAPSPPGHTKPPKGEVNPPVSPPEGINCSAFCVCLGGCHDNECRKQCGSKHPSCAPENCTAEQRKGKPPLSKRHFKHSH